MGVRKFGISLVTTVMNLLLESGAATGWEPNSIKLVAAVGRIIPPTNACYHTA
jgi:hypothetical protein